MQKISGGSTIHEKGVVQMIKSKRFLINIRRLSFIDQNCIYEKVLCKAVSAMKQLEYLDLTGCVHVTDNVILSLMNRKDTNRWKPRATPERNDNLSKFGRKDRHQDFSLGKLW